MNTIKFWSILVMLNTIFISIETTAQKSSANHVYIDRNGILRTTADKKEAAFFGVNYTVPFAYGYRSHRALGIDIEKAIDADVYHMWRLGLNAFRVHVWDVEISDSLGNLLQNEHLRLFDYLLKKLKERNIKILLTPIAFWGNGYPERDEKTVGFSSVYGKNNSVVLEAPIRAQENYLRQFFTHKNPYTGLTYKDDPDIIAMEINNEPKHSGPKEKTKEYINRLAAAVRSTGWTKPVFYNISESPSYADAVVQSSVDGYSFQWYPTGLVKGHELKGNFLPHVDQYYIPFFDTLPGFAKKPRMVYEFDAGDLMQPIMYPAMARSFRKAGFQWATQFAYDPMATAYGNTEYQTHYLNLAYTPAKAISLMIAGKIFTRLPRMKEEKRFPADSVFDVFTISYARQLSEMNSEGEFYYTSTTETVPVNQKKLEHIAGTGSSPVVHYAGTGAYFLDKQDDGSWRLELMPDAIPLEDPFRKASPSRMVTAIHWKHHPIQVLLEELGPDFRVSSITGNHPPRQVTNGTFIAEPGVYFLFPRTSGRRISQSASKEFYAPEASIKNPLLVHTPKTVVSAHQPFPISALAAGIDSNDIVSIELRNSSNQWKTIPMIHKSSLEVMAELPADMITPGVMNYRMMVKKPDGITFTFPGAHKGDPYAWDNIHNESWECFVAASSTPIEIFNAAKDRDQIIVLNPDWRNNSVSYITADKPGQLVMKLVSKQLDTGKVIGFQFFAKDKLYGRQSELDSMQHLVIRGRSEQEITVHLTLITAKGQSMGTSLLFGKTLTEVEIPLDGLKLVPHLLLPLQYPSFRPLFYQPPSKIPFQIRDVEKIEIHFNGKELSGKPVNVEIEYLWLKK